MHDVPIIWDWVTFLVNDVTLQIRRTVNIIYKHNCKHNYLKIKNIFQKKNLLMTYIIAPRKGKRCLTIKKAVKSTIVIV